MRNCEREILSSVLRERFPSFQYSIKSSSVYASGSREKEIPVFYDKGCDCRRGKEE